MSASLNRGRPRADTWKMVAQSWTTIVPSTGRAALKTTARPIARYALPNRAIKGCILRPLAGPSSQMPPVSWVAHGGESSGLSPWTNSWHQRRRPAANRCWPLRES